MKKYFIILILSTLLFKSAFAQWQFANGPYGGQVNSIASDNLKIVAGTNNGVFLSADDGVNWTAINNGLPNSSVISEIAINNNIICTVVNDDYIYLSTNFGQSWSEIYTSTISNFFNCITIHDTIIYIGTLGGGVISTNDLGVNWQQLYNGMTVYNISSIVCTDSSIFVSSENEIYFSNDNGSFWNSVYNNGNYIINNVVISNSEIFASTYNGIIHSTDFGNSWTSYNNGILDTTIFSIAVNNTHIIANALTGIFVSELGLVNWNLTNLSNSQSNFINRFAFNNSTFLIANYSGVSRSTDYGLNWSSSNNGMNNLNIKTIKLKDDTLYAGSLGGGMHRKHINETTWTSINNGLTTEYIYSIEISDDNIFVGTNKGVYFSSNYGSSWTTLNAGLPIDISVNTILKVDSVLYIGTSQYGVFKSANNGLIWNSVNNGLTDSTILALGSVDADIFTGTLDGVFKSTNSGIMWNSANSGITTNAIQVFETNGFNIFAGGYPPDGLFISSNSGGFWTPISNGITTPNVYSIAFYGSAIFVGTYGGRVFMSTDNGLNWTDIHAGLPLIAAISALAVDSNTIYAGTGKGVYKRSLSEILIASLYNNNLNQGFKVYPNPLKDYAILSSKGTSEIKSITLNSLLGAEIWRQDFNTPLYQHQILMSEFSEGIYFLTVLDQNDEKTIYKVVKH